MKILILLVVLLVAPARAADDSDIEYFPKLTTEGEAEVLLIRMYDSVTTVQPDTLDVRIGIGTREIWRTQVSNPTLDAAGKATIVLPRQALRVLDEELPVETHEVTIEGVRQAFPKKKVYKMRVLNVNWYTVNAQGTVIPKPTMTPTP